MAFSGITKLISQLTESASASDTDNLIIGGSDAKKITFSNFKKAILNISNLSSTTSISDADNLIVGNTDAKKITWAQIIALIKTKLNIGNADISGIGDGTVKGAIVGLNGKIKTQSFAGHVSLPSKGEGRVDMGRLNIPTGYTYIGVISKDSDYGDQFLCSFQRYGDHIYVVVRNTFAGTLTGDVSCTALFLKN